MAWTRPNYIPPELEKFTIAHQWDDGNPYSLLGDVDPFTEQALSKVTARAAIAYAIGCAEWVVFRFCNLSDDPRPYLFIEASWAFQMSNRYACPPESDESEWKGEIRGPIDLTLMTILNTIYAVEDGSPHVEAAFAEQLPLHVIPNQQNFLNWRGTVLERLQHLYPISTADNMGPPVPREALDPSSQFDSAGAAKLVDMFFENLDEKANSYLRT